ncbi:MAG: hypothetical protein JSW58_17560 [Candidatus Latescibacterota bacterium]|nr:MAG: hypothetical protein JSW58_17560 [Candidatus Latescibacterota bacterium]
MYHERIIIICLAVAVIAFFGGCSDSPTPVSPGDGTDVSPPAAIADAVLIFSEETGTALLEWTAPCDDSPTEGVSGYEIRYTYTQGYDPPDFWNRSTPVDDPPEPLEPGTSQHYTFDDLRRARDFYVGIRSVDEQGNWSANVDPVTIYIPGFSFAGRCVAVYTGTPLEGLEVTVATGPAVRYTTDANGEFVHQTDLGVGVTHVEILTGASEVLYHPLSQPFVLYDDSVHTFQMIPVEPVQVTWIPNMLSLLKLFVPKVLPSSQSGQDVAPQPSILAKWHRRPVPCYIPPFVNEHGLDYEMEAKRAAQRWMDRTGEPLFTFVDAPQDTGIVLTY